MTVPSHFDQRGQSIETETNIVHADNVIIQSTRSASALIVPHQILPPPPDFAGREDEINGLLEQFSQGASITGLRGMGGIGKTALALILADQLKDRFPDGQIFLNMQGTSKSPLKPEDAMAHVIRSYRGADASLPKDLNGLSGLYQTVLSGRKTLMLLDNAASREQVEPLLPPKGCALLVTSRNKFALPSLEERDLDVLPMEDSKKLLLAICERIGDHAEELANLCGCLPLALRNAAYAIKEMPNLTPVGYVERLADFRKRLKLVEASFDLSYQLLPDRLKEIWSLLSVFPADFDLDGAEAVWQMEEALAENVLGELVRWSLVDFLPSAIGGAGRYKLHDLARDFAGSRLDEAALELAKLHHAEHYCMELASANQVFSFGREGIVNGLKVFDRERANILAGQSWAEKSLEINSSSINLCKDFPNSGAFIIDLRLHPDEKIVWLKAGLQASRLSKDSSIEGICLGNLGRAYSELGKTLEAIEYYEQALKIAREIGDRNAEGANLNNLGLANSDSGWTWKAIEYFEQALKIAREVGDRRYEGNRLGNLGLAYCDLGWTWKAIEHQEQALKIACEIGDRRGEANRLSNLGLAYCDLGLTWRAIELQEQALKIAREIGDRRCEGYCLSNLGIVSHDWHWLNSKKINYLEQAVEIAREIGDTRCEGYSLSNLGLYYDELGSARKAVKYQEQSLKIARESGCRRFEGDILSNLGLAYFDLNGASSASNIFNSYPRSPVDTSKAIGYFKQALEIAREVGDRRGEGNRLGNLGLAYSFLGDVCKSKVNFKFVFKKRKIGDESDKNKNHISFENDHSADEAKNAILYYERAMKYFEGALKIAYEIACWRVEGKQVENWQGTHAWNAIECYRNALKTIREIARQRKERKRISRLDLKYSNLSEFQNAIEQCKHALEISCEIGDRRREGFGICNTVICFSRIERINHNALVVKRQIKMWEK